MSQPSIQTNLSLSEARAIVADLFQPNPKIYWADFLASWIIGVACFRLVREFPLFSPMQLGLFVVSGLMIYRAGIFTHELTHLKSGSFRWFRIVWNLMAGIPFLIPSFTYQTHVDHHRRRLYGTGDDGEYLPLSSNPPWQILLYLAQMFIVPPLAVIRFGLLTPLTWFSPRFRDWVHRHASSMVIDPMYLRPLPTRQALRIIRLQELGCFLFLCTAATLMAIGIVPWKFVIPQAYLTGAFAVCVNGLRTLGAHHYLGDGRQMTFFEQLQDSVNYSDRAWLGLFWAPVGLRYHATHHLFPSLPYHALREAHQRLMQQLPANSIYRRTEADSLWKVLAGLWRRASEGRPQEVEQRRAA